jgi:small subunit ribosomal protein S5
VVKGGKLMGFRCTAVVGNGKGLVGVGCQAGREVATAVKRALVDAKKNLVRVSGPRALQDGTEDV